MSRQLLAKLAALLVALVVLWGAFALLRQVRQDRNIALKLPRVDTAMVDTIALSRKAAGQTVVIARRSGSGGGWTVNGFRADSVAIAQLLYGLLDTTRKTELVAQSKSSHARLHVDADSGQHVRVIGKGSTLLELFTGDRTDDFGGGLLIREPDGEAVYALRGPLGDALGRASDTWRDKRIAKADPDSLGTVAVVHGKRAYSLKRGADGWRLSSGVATDSNLVRSLLLRFQDIKAAGFATKAQEDSADFKSPYGRLRLLSRAGTPVLNLVFDSTASGVWVRADSGGVVYRMETWVWNSLVPHDSTLRAKK